MKHRSKCNIIKSILEIIKNDPQQKTDIVYKCNLNFTVVKPYLEMLIKKKYITLSNNKFIITETGIDLLNKIKEVTEMIK
jgi:predicted transcriptional regulator